MMLPVHCATLRVPALDLAPLDSSRNDRPEAGDVVVVLHLQAAPVTLQFHAERLPTDLDADLFRFLGTRDALRLAATCTRFRRALRMLPVLVAEIRRGRLLRALDDMALQWEHAPQRMPRPTDLSAILGILRESGALGEEMEPFNHALAQTLAHPAFMRLLARARRIVGGPPAAGTEGMGALRN